MFYLLYVVWIGGDFMSGRFFSTPLLVAVLLLTTGPVLARTIRVAATSAVALGLSLLASGGPLQSLGPLRVEPAELFDDWGIADERLYYFNSSGLWNGFRGPKPSHEAIDEVRTIRERDP